MALIWAYFLILQVLIVLLYYFRRNKKDNFVLSKLFPTKIHFVIVNSCIFIACFLFNIDRQLFCIPVLWASVLIILFILSFLLIPFIKPNNKFLSITAAVCGLGLFIVVYILLFAQFEYLLFVVLNVPVILVIHVLVRYERYKTNTNILEAFYLYPAIILTPFLLLFQLWIILKSLPLRKQKLIFISTPILITILFFMLTFQIKTIINKIDIAKDKEKEIKEIIANPINNYLTELILGAHWKYHTELCLYDGYRPPFHDPVLVIANKILYPYSLFRNYPDLPSTIELYKKIYPNNPTSFNCQCGKNEHLFEDN